jgi:hypothetical protein
MRDARASNKCAGCCWPDQVNGRSGQGSDELPTGAVDAVLALDRRARHVPDRKRMGVSCQPEVVRCRAAQPEDKQNQTYVQSRPRPSGPSISPLFQGFE